MSTNDASWARTDRYTWSCTSSHTSLSQCSYTFVTGAPMVMMMNMDLSVTPIFKVIYLKLICITSYQIGTECVEGDIKLVDGTSSDNGRVMYCFEGYWTPLCSLSTNTASAICQTLGYNSSCKY